MRLRTLEEIVGAGKPTTALFYRGIFVLLSGRGLPRLLTLPLVISVAAHRLARHPLVSRKLSGYRLFFQLRVDFQGIGRDESLYGARDTHRTAPEAAASRSPASPGPPPGLRKVGRTSQLHKRTLIPLARDSTSLMMSRCSSAVGRVRSSSASFVWECRDSFDVTSIIGDPSILSSNASCCAAVILSMLSLPNCLGSARRLDRSRNSRSQSASFF